MSKKIQVLGSGCARCSKLHMLVVQAVQELNAESPVEYISGSEGTTRIVTLGGMSSPAIAVDDEIVMTGFTPSVETIKSILAKHL